MSTLSLPADQHLAIEEAIASWRGTAPDCRVALLSWERTLDTLSALSLYDRLRSLGSKHFFLESLQGGERWGRYSFLGSGSVVELTAWADGLYLARGEQAPQRQAGTEANPIEAAQDFLANVCLVRPEDGSLPGGAVGYVSYDAARLFEPVLQRDHDFDPNCPLLRLWVPEILVRVDALRQSISLLVCVDLSQTLEARVKGEPWRQHCRQLLESGREKAQKVLRHLEEGQGTLSVSTPIFERATPERVDSLVSRAQTTLDQEQFCQAVERCREYIRAGDIIQVVLSQRLRLSLEEAFGDADMDLLQVYRRLRLINPSPYLFMLDLGDEQFLGSSPEVMVRKRGEHIAVRPIAGTRPRGQTPEEDQALARELLEDEKERAEHIMLLDLGRNDIGRACQVGSVEVAEQMVIERYSHVMHLVSHVTGRLSPGLGWSHALGATFPAGTLSGAPKVRAMQIIDEVEPAGRRVYGGAVGYIGFDGDMDFGIAIRTLHVRDGWVDVQAGAGIVVDSDPRKEWQETLHKAGALLSSMVLPDDAP